MTTQDFVAATEHRLAELEEEARRIRAQIAEIQADAARRVNELQTSLRAKEELAARLRDVLRIETGENGVGEYQEDATVPVSSPVRPPTNLADAAYQLLAETRREYHYRELAQELLDRGVLINGRDPATNLIAHLVRDNRFARPKRGVYALREWNPKAHSVGQRKRKSRRKRRRPAGAIS